MKTALPLQKLAAVLKETGDIPSQKLALLKETGDINS